MITGMGIASLASTVLGMLSGTVPDLIAEVKASRQHKRDLETLARQAELQRQTAEIEGATRRAEAEANVAAEEIKAAKEQLLAVIQAQAQPTGVRFVDGWNGAIRPATATVMLILFAAIAGCVTAAVIEQYQAGHIPALDLPAIAWAGPIGEAIGAFLGFTFGARQVRKRIS